MNKQTIRQTVLQARNQLISLEVQEKSQHILQRLENLENFQKAQSVLFYYSYQNEVQTIQTIEKWMKSKKIYLPKLEEGGVFKMVQCKNLNDLVPNQYGILEPVGEETEEAIDLIIVPGVAFDLKGNRIGMGKGYYDRFLAQYKTTLKVALAYELQIFDELPKDPYDEPVDLIITEQRIIIAQYQHS